MEIDLINSNPLAFASLCFLGAAFLFALGLLAKFLCKDIWE